MTREESTDWLCRLRADLNNGVIFTPWNKEFTEALNEVLEQEPKTDITEIRNLLSELIEMIDTGSQRDLDRADEIAEIIVKALEQEPYKESEASDDPDNS